MGGLNKENDSFWLELPARERENLEPVRIGGSRTVCEGEQEVIDGLESANLGGVEDIFTMLVRDGNFFGMKIRKDGDEIFMLRRNNSDLVGGSARGDKLGDFCCDVGIFGLVGWIFAQFDEGVIWWIFGGDTFIDVDGGRFAKAIFGLFDNVMSKRENRGAGAIVFG